MLHVKIKLLPQGRLPTKGSRLAAGWDLYAAAAVYVPPRDVRCVPLGIVLEIPVGWYGQANPRSGMCVKGIETSIGTVDADYRGELTAMVKNHTDFGHMVAVGDRVVQLVFLPVPEVEWQQVEEVGWTARGAAGFGSTGA